MPTGWRVRLAAEDVVAAWLDRRVLTAIGLLLGADALLVLVHAARFVCLRYQLDGGALLDPTFALATNGGWAELGGHLKTIGLIGLLVRLGRTTREVAYLAFAGLFLAVLVDDATGVDQPAGALMVRLLDLTDSLGIQAQCLGELVVFAAIGLPLGGALARAVGRTGAAHRRPIAVLILLSVALALFAIVVDLVHITFIRAFFGSRLVLEVLEEGGEMLTLSLAFAHVLATWLAEPRARGRLGPEPAAA